MIIEDIRFVERNERVPVFVPVEHRVYGPGGKPKYTTVSVRVLQVKMDGKWQDIRTEKED